MKNTISSLSFYIRNSLIDTALCEEPLELLKAFLKKTSAERSIVYASVAQDKVNTSELLGAPIKKLSGLQAKDRIYALLDRSLPKLSRRCALYDFSRILIYLCLPQPESARGLLLHNDMIRQLIYEIEPKFKSTRIVFHREEGNTLNILKRVQNYLESKNWDGVILGGIDSLVNFETYTELINTQNLRTLTNREGDLPGEGSAFVFFESEKTDQNMEFQLIPIPSWEDELLKTIQLCFSNRLQDRRSQFKWYEKSHQRWGMQVPEEISLNRWLGNVGAVYTPLLLALAKAAIEQSYDSEQRLKSILLCEKDFSLLKLACECP